MTSPQADTEPVLPIWRHAFGGPAGSGDIKSVPDDFIVAEHLPFVPSGSGEHVFLHLEKCGENTEYVARLLARHAGVRQRDIGYAGLKDRHARTSQWFSVWLPGREAPDWAELLQANSGLKLLAAVRHQRKLQRGVLAGNRFRITLRNLRIDHTQATLRLQAIAEHGFPNYFGPQRFGHQANNIRHALAMFAGGKVRREQQGIYLSAARAWLFNQVLSARVADGSWLCGLPGEVCMLAGGNSRFHAADIDAGLRQRLDTGDIHTSGPLWGTGDSGVTAEAQALEQTVIAAHPQLAAGLLQAGVAGDRRPLRILADSLEWQFAGDDGLCVEFGLPPGSYATSLLREVADFGLTTDTAD